MPKRRNDLLLKGVRGLRLERSPGERGDERCQCPRSTSSTCYNVRVGKTFLSNIQYLDKTLQILKPFLLAFCFQKVIGVLQVTSHFLPSNAFQADFIDSEMHFHKVIQRCALHLHPYAGGISSPCTEEKWSGTYSEVWVHTDQDHALAVAATSLETLLLT